MYITWKYDLFPFELCGKVLQSKGDNFYTVEGFGGMEFEAKRRIKDDAAGAVIKEFLEKSTETYRQERDFLDRHHREHVAFMLSYLVGLK